MSSLSLKRALQTVRPPRPVATMRIPGAVVRPHVLLTSIQHLTSAWNQRSELDLDTIVIVPDGRRGTTPNQTTIDALTESLAPVESLVVVRTPTAASTTTHSHGQRVREVRPGSSGWVRIRSNSIATLPYVDVPTELASDHHVILLTVSPSSAGVVGAWSEIVHPSSALRARIAATGAITDLAVATPATYVMLLDNAASGAVAIANGPLAAELVALGATRLAEHRRGIEAEGPWEDTRVQRLVEVSIGFGISTTLSLVPLVTDEMGNRRRQWMTQLAAVLGCRLSATDTVVRGTDEK